MIGNGKLSLNFIIVWFGQFVSSIGSGLTAFALGIFIFEKTNSAFNFSMVIFFSFLPSFLLRPLGGTLSDRYDRRLMMIIGDIGSGLGLLFILIMLQSGISDLWVIYLGVAFSSVFVALQNPAYKASVTDLLDEQSYSKGSGLMQLAESAKFLVSPIVAGLLLGFWSIEEVIIIDILTFLIAVLAVFKIKFYLPKKSGKMGKNEFILDLKTGFKFTFSHKALFYLLLITSFVTFFVGILQSLLGPMTLVFTDSKTFGVMLSIMASGMLVSSFIIGVFSKSERQLMILSISLMLSGFFYAALGVSTSITFLIIIGFLFFLTLPFINTSLDVLIRKNVPNEMQGRVWSIVSFISQIGMMISYGIAGFLADYCFNPLLKYNGLLSSSIGIITGVGEGRGIALMFILSGLFIVIISFMIPRLPQLKSLESEN